MTICQIEDARRKNWFYFKEKVFKLKKASVISPPILESKSD